MGIDPMPVSPEELLAEVEWVRRVARALVGRGEIDDVVQQAYVQALSMPPAAGPVRRWLSKVVRNVVRRRARDDATRGRHEARTPIPARTPEPGETVARAELHRRVVEAVLALDEPYRSTLLLRFFEDQSAEAIAQSQSLPVETVRTRVKRGIAQLRARLERAAGGDDAAGVAAQAFWFQQLSAFAGDGTKGAVAGGSAAAAAGLVATTARAVWIASSLAAALVVGAAAWWVHARSARSTEPRAISPTRGDAPPVAAASEAAPAPASPAAATRTLELTPAAPAAPAGLLSGAMKPLVGGPRGVIRGRVTDAQGAPVAGAEVRAQTVYAHGILDLREFAALASERARRSSPDTDKAGEFVTRSDVDGRFELDRLSTVSDWGVGAFDRTRGAAVSELLRFGPDAETRDAVLRLTPCALVHGSVHDDEGRCVEDATITVGASLGSASQWRWFTSGFEGLWSAGYYCCDSVSVMVEAPGLVSVSIPRRSLATASGELALDVVLHWNGSRKVSGSIVVVNGAPAASDEVTDPKALLDAAIGPPADPRWMVPPSPGYGRVAVGAVADGQTPPIAGKGLSVAGVVGRVDLDHARYQVPLPADFHGTLYLAVFGRVVGTALLDDVAQPPPLPFEVSQIPPKETKTRLVVRVVDAVTCEPIDLAHGFVAVTSPSTGRGPYGSIDRPGTERGVAEFDVWPGRLKIRPEVESYAVLVSEVVVPDNERHHEVTLALDRATAGLRGRALRSDGTTNQRSRISLYRITPAGVVETHGSDCLTNMYGEFEILGLAAAEHVVVVADPDDCCAVARVRAADPPAEFELKAVPGTRIGFHLKLAGPSATAIGSPTWHGQMFRIVDEEAIPLLDELESWTSSSDESETLAAMLRPGSYRLFVSRAGYREASRNFVVPSSDPIELELEPAR